MVTYFGVALAAALAIIFTYVPEVNNFIGAEAVGREGWVTAVVLGAVLLVFNEGRAFIARKHPKSRLTQWTSW